VQSLVNTWAKPIRVHKVLIEHLDIEGSRARDFAEQVSFDGRYQSFEHCRVLEGCGV
jgi:hypothetical protein